jgi:hypothetical protein
MIEVARWAKRARRMVDSAPMRRVRRNYPSGAIVALVATLLAVGCGSDQPLQMTTFQLGRSINPDKTVSQSTTRFKPIDTIYVAVLTEGSGAGKIKVRWLFAGRVVSEPEQDVSYRGAAATEFHIQNSGGFPPGNYTVEIFIDGRSVGSRAFRVEADAAK